MPYKQDYDKILTRLVAILSQLNNGEALSIKELTDEFNPIYAKLDIQELEIAI